MDNVYFDIETRSNLPIDVGTVKYMSTPDSDLICIGYSVNQESPKIWIPGLPVPLCFKDTKDKTYYALNIQFDHRGINVLGKKHSFSRIDIEQCVDVMALLARFTFPQSLDRAGKVLDTETKKMESGKGLKKIICSPPYVCTKEQMAEFYMYCLGDVQTMIDIINALPSDRLSPLEQQYWLDTVRINARGIPIDLRAAARISATVEFYMQKRVKGLPLLCAGSDPPVTKATQVKRIRDWMWGSYGIKTDNLNKETVQELIDADSTYVPSEVKEVLAIRQDIGGAAVKKYIRLIQQTYYGRIYNNLRYAAASTLRFGGLGFQVHNLPRAHVDVPDGAIKMFENGNILFHPYIEVDEVDGKVVETKHTLMETAKALVRPMIRATEGNELLVADYKSIEAVFLMWMAGELHALRMIREGFDLYKDMASYLYNIAYGEVTDHQRFLGKTLILGAGYQLGWRGFIRYAEGYGLHITPQQAEHAINSYRAKYPLIVKLWKKLSQSAMAALENPGREFGYRNNNFKMLRDRNGTNWLRYMLPSGRPNWYYKPHIGAGMYGPSVWHWGIDSKTKTWTRKELTPGRITENGDQGISRDRLCHGVRMLFEDSFHPIFHVHDEAVCEETIGRRTLERMIDVMCMNPDWCSDLPLMADGYVSERYKKG